ncbi:hypothetical protein [Mycolicibacterium setense]|uniref:hypothetical protein n=1 Tax=Mycolicibacterium setense TaxID=431269 RepID=UPI000575C07D|nr:hypothetical protein [Mycolicibacterium setense]KHO25773.1 hypothetical protein QQ25_01085 [Mycolicibacterium setense]MCV7110618.1 hypothetical protein [Mycolicibacterium setense]
MTAETWRGGINMILYGLENTKELDEANAALMADAMVEYRYFVDGPQFFLTAIQDALATRAVIMTDEWAEPPYGLEELRHSEGEVRNFLAMVAEQLKRRQPWPPKTAANH